MNNLKMFRTPKEKADKELWEEGKSLSELADKYDEAKEKEQLTKEEKEDLI